MANSISKTLRRAVGAVALSAFAAAGAVSPALAAGEAGSEPFISTQNTRTIKGERYIPGISISPDGCEIWVMDDGVEGYAVSRVTPDGRPVCRDVNVCGVINSDQYFATDSFRVWEPGRRKLEEFFTSSDAFAFIIVGHTDSRASREYNQRLSINRANSVAKIARSVGARIVDVRGYGEDYPVATNATAEGMAKNRRVEILCVR